MGTFGYGPLDSDDAMSVIEDWEDMVEKRGMKPEDAKAKLLAEWGQPIHTGKENEVIALTGLCLEKGLDLGNKLKDSAVEAINRELTPGALEKWDSSEERKKALVELLTKIGGKRKKVKFKVVNPKVSFASHTEARRVLLRIAELSNKYGISGVAAMGCSGLDPEKSYLATVHPGIPKDDFEFLKANMPEFMKRTWEVVQGDLSEEGSNVFVLAFTQRIMMLACWVGMDVNAGPEEMKKVFDRIIK